MVKTTVVDFDAERVAVAVFFACVLVVVLVRRVESMLDRRAEMELKRME